MTSDAPIYFKYRHAKNLSFSRLGKIIGEIFEKLYSFQSPILFVRMAQILHAL
jgi:hypothetical protein